MSSSMNPLDRSAVVVAAQQAFAPMPDRAIAIGLDVRSAFAAALPHHVAATRLPSPAYFGSAHPAAVGPVEDVQRAAARRLMASEGADPAVALAWMLSATNGSMRMASRRQLTDVATDALRVFAEEVAAHDSAQHRGRVTYVSVLANYMRVVRTSDPAGAVVAAQVTNMAPPVHDYDGALLSAEALELVMLFSGNTPMWQLHCDADRSSTSTSLSGHRKVIADLRVTAALAGAHSAEVVRVAATLASDSPDTHTVAEALHIASMIVTPCTPGAH